MPGVVKLRETESRLWLLGAWHRKEWELFFVSTKFQFGKMKNFPRFIVQQYEWT